MNINQLINELIEKRDGLEQGGNNPNEVEVTVLERDGTIVNEYDILDVGIIPERKLLSKPITVGLRI